MGKKAKKTSGSASGQKVFGIRGFDDKLITAVKILALKRKTPVRALMEEAARDLLKKYNEPF